MGSNIQAGVEGEANIKAQGDITQAGVKDIDYSYSKKSKSRFGGLISKSTTKENMQESAIKSAAVAGNKGLVYDSKNDLLLEGVNVVSTGNIKLKGDNVIINPIETESYNKVKKEKKGFGGSLSPTSVSLSYGKDKFSSDTINKVENPSEITSSKNIDIEASNKVNAKAVNVYAKEDINISGDKGVEFSTGINSQERKIKQSSTKASIGLSVKSEIVDTIENIKNADKLVNFSGDYSVLNTASNLVGAIRTGADTVNTIGKNAYGDSSTADFSMFDNISKNPEDYINLTAGISKSKSEIKTYEESVVKNSIEGKDINISSKEGSVVLEGTDIKAKNLSLEAKENIEIKAADEKHKSSNKSSSSGLSASISASETPITLMASASGAKGRGSGTGYVNSTIEVKEKLKAESENLKISGANIEADKVDIKAKDIVIKSKQDVSERKESSFGGSLSVAIGAEGITPKDISINGSKGKGESKWVNKQTTVITRNGGSIEAENKLANTGAVLGSLNEEEKLKISAKEIEVKDLEDKDKYENKGGGISLGFDGMKPKIPNISVSHDKVDKEQINRATAVNTELIISGEEKNAEELGFNTNLEKAQEKTKDEEKHLNAKLHTDLLNESEIDKLKEAGKKLTNVAEALTSSGKTLGNLSERYTQSTLADGMADVILDNTNRLSILEKEAIKDGKINDEVVNEKAGAMLTILEDTLTKLGYKGKEIRFAITDVIDPNGNTFTSTKEHITVLDRKFLATATKEDLLERVAHEFGHYTKEDNEMKSQKVAKYFSSLVMEKVKGVPSKTATEETYARIRNNKNVITGKEGNEIAKSIPMEDREYKVYQMSRELDYSKEYYEYKKSNTIKAKGYYHLMKITGLGTHGYALVVPDEQLKFFDEKGELRQEYKHYPKPEKYGDKWGWTVGGHNINGKLEVVFNQEQDKKVSQKKLLEDTSDKLTPLKGHIGKELESSKYSKDTEFIEALMEDAINYKINNENKISPKYGAFGQGSHDYYDPRQGYMIQDKDSSYNCNSFMNTLSERLKIENFNKNMPGVDPGSNAIIGNEYFETNK
ncbi:hypothetical protein IX329_002559 [Fusobacterium necrophorum]